MFLYLRGPLGKASVFFSYAFLHRGTKTPHRDNNGATARRGGGEEEEEERRGGHISFARARYLEDGLAQSFARTHDANTEHDYPVSSLNLRFQWVVHLLCFKSA